MERIQSYVNLSMKPGENPVTQEQSAPASSIYSPLPSPEPGKNPVRILHILPGKPLEVVRCELVVVMLEDAPPFEALSYVWGDPDPPELIICNGYRKHVTPNLGAAMRRLRLEDTERVVWIDALSVNQDDLEERSEQVRLMKDIFSRPWRVIVWLGDDNGLAEEAIRIIEKAAGLYAEEVGKSFGDMDRDTFRSYIKSEGVGDPEYKDRCRERGLPPYYWRDENGCSPWDSVTWFYRHAWFSRIWIIQEVAFTHVVMYIGAHHVEWIRVLAAALWLPYKGYVRRADDVVDFSRVMQVLSARHVLGRAIGIHLISFSQFATDPRDQIFALLGLCDDSEKCSRYLQPDYTKDTATIYTDTVRHIIEQNNPDHPSIGLWTLLERASRFPDEQDENFPSWVPRWDLPKTGAWNLLCTAKEPWRASAKTVEELIQIPNSRILRIGGLKIAHVQYVNNTLAAAAKADPWNITTIKRLWDEVSPNFDMKGVKLETAKLAFTRTVTAGSTVETAEGRRLFNADDLDHALSPVTNEDLLLALENRNHEARTALDLHIGLRNFPFFIADNKLIGLSTNVLEQGDIAVVFFGHNYPYILRPVGSQYRFRGTCYVDGYMNGESIEEMEAGTREAEWFDLI